MVLANNVMTGNEITAAAHFLPATHITYSDGKVLFSYLQSTQSPHGYITKAITELNTKPAPFMAAFSSQGPNTVNPEILKPDITAPGVSVIAAYTRALSPTGLVYDHRRISFNSESGTSMSCPHISGIVGLLKTLYPHWSPAAIKSAIMTSARTRDNKEEPMLMLNSSFVRVTPFSYGSGHVRPNRAMDPGLVYDLTTSDYLNFLCALGYKADQLALFTTSTAPYKCPAKPIRLEDFNYPSITVPNLSGSITVSRTVKNVGPPGTYTVRVRPPKGIQVAIRPKSLKFDSVGEEKKFQVTLKVENRAAASDYVFGVLVWSDGKRYARSPLVVKAAGRKP
ncbi:subtilisin-like protease SBT5.4 [Ananas comosus]|uniref:Subtilisin-like protease SBT5.4 n=1 Tax=Ananas comosus TaxID=4615 RepID=A0A6P5GT77_ANACO|nr:subtilisin-like protease SBT5.4 [Ananas comosus]